MKIPRPLIALFFFQAVLGGQILWHASVSLLARLLVLFLELSLAAASILYYSIQEEPPLGKNEA